MTNEEAIKMIEDDLRLHHDALSGQYRKALRMAIEALKLKDGATVNRDSLRKVAGDNRTDI